jgi:hypothetical protein
MSAGRPEFLAVAMSDADSVKIPPAVSGLGGWLDDRFHGARGVRVLMRKVFPDHWSFMLGEIALWSFVILLLTGTYLALFFKPSMQDVVYHGSYTKHLTVASLRQAKRRAGRQVRDNGSEPRRLPRPSG